jgi:hypothetical protein
MDFIAPKVIGHDDRSGQGVYEAAPSMPSLARITLARFVLASLLAALNASCARRSPDATASRKPSALDATAPLTALTPAHAPELKKEQFLSEYARVYCDHFAECCEGRDGRPSRTQCEEGVLSIFETQDEFDPVAAKACIEAVRHDDEACFSLDFRYCGGVFRGKAKPGETCSGSGDCAKSEQGEVLCETLVKPAAQAAAQPQQVRECALMARGKRDSACNTDLTRQVRTRFGGAVQWQAFRLGPGTEVSRNESTIPTQGSTWDACYSTDLLRCVSGKCTAAAAGTCRRPADCSEGNEYCDQTLLQCRPLPVAGQACEPASGRSCIDGSHCSAGLCNAPLPDGQTCLDPDACASGVCELGKCLASSDGRTATQRRDKKRIEATCDGVGRGFKQKWQP